MAIRLRHPRIRGLPYHLSGLGIALYAGVAVEVACLRSRAMTIANHHVLIPRDTRMAIHPSGHRRDSVMCPEYSLRRVSEWMNRHCENG